MVIYCINARKITFCCVHLHSLTLDSCLQPHKTLFSSSSTAFFKETARLFLQMQLQDHLRCAEFYHLPTLSHTCAFVHIFIKYLVVVFDFTDVKFPLARSPSMSGRVVRTKPSYYGSQADMLTLFFFSYFKHLSLLLEEN